MEHIPLNNHFELSFEKLPHTIRLIVLKNKEEWVCRKEKIENLLSFVDECKDHLFKGRLQLLKSNGKIAVQVKNELIGALSYEAFTEVLCNLK